MAEKRKIEVKPIVRLEEGKHEGIIVGIEYRDEPYEYTDLLIEEKETKLILKAGVPTYLSPTSRFGKLLSMFLGRELQPHEELVPEDILIGREVTFLTTIEKTEKGEFSKILVNTIKPKVAVEKVEAGKNDG